MADVFYIPLASEARDSGEVVTGAFADLVNRLDLVSGAGPWALKVDVGPRGRRPRIESAWADAVGRALAGGQGASVPTGSFCFDTLSITTRGLDTAADHLDLARDKGFGADPAGLPYLVADGPDQGPSLLGRLADGAEIGLAAGMAGTGGVCVLNPVRPHPHLGFLGAVAALAAAGTDRATKIELHRDIRPSVDTPLCAGCGSCLDVCLFDAIEIAAGRAYIDHEKCTGCGECMTVCFMAGIEPEQAAGVVRFQARLAEAALAVRTAVADPPAGRLGCFNVLLDGRGRRAGVRALRQLDDGPSGILASGDPVALDQATWDLISGGDPAALKPWSGYGQRPEALLERAAEVGLGSREHRLITI